jgi:putative mRNA 3-end processing factor
MAELLELSERGLYCAAGDFYVDPWRPVDRAVVTHAHADHARRDSNRYLTVPEGERVLRTRMGASARIETVPYGQKVTVNGVTVSLHPAGHILGSAQVRVEHGGEVWVVSGDYKTEPDPTCTAFEPVRCHTFITESTFGLPIYQWPDQASVFAEVNAWWRENAEAGKSSLLCGYALGKAQRLLAGVDASIGPIYCHGAVEACNRDYRAAGVPLPATEYAGQGERGKNFAGSLVVAPPSALGTPYLRKFGDVSTAFASGWMLVRGQRRRRAVDRGFVLSDHADWPELFGAIKDTGCERVYVTHGSRAVMVRRLRELGYEAHALETWFEGEQDTGGAEAEEEAALVDEATNE